MEGAVRARARPLGLRQWMLACGPGLLVMLADTDAGNVVTGAEAGAQWGYRLLPLLLLLIPMLYMVQELTVRLGLYTGRGHGDLIRERFGVGWAWLSTAGLAVATIGSLVTEFTGVAGVGELYGLPRGLTLPLAGAALLAVVATGSYRRVERTAIAVGLFELAFFGVAWAAHPSPGVMLHDALDLPLGDPQFLFLSRRDRGDLQSLDGFLPAVGDRRQKAAARHLAAARWDTAFGAVLTQCLTGAVLVAAAAALAPRGHAAGLDSIGRISDALAPFLGDTFGRLVFSAGVLGASLVAAIVSSLALAWGVGEVTGYHRSLEYRPFAAKWFYGLYAAAVCGSAALVGFAPISSA